MKKVETFIKDLLGQNLDEEQTLDRVIDFLVSETDISFQDEEQLERSLVKYIDILKSSGLDFDEESALKVAISEYLWEAPYSFKVSIVMQYLRSLHNGYKRGVLCEVLSKNFWSRHEAVGSLYEGLIDEAGLEGYIEISGYQTKTRNPQILEIF